MYTEFVEFKRINGDNNPRTKYKELVTLSL